MRSEKGQKIDVLKTKYVHSFIYRVTISRSCRISICMYVCSVYVCLIITVKRLDRAVPNFVKRSTLAQRVFFYFFLFFLLFLILFLTGAGFGWYEFSEVFLIFLEWRGLWMVKGRKWEGMGVEWRGRERKGCKTIQVFKKPWRSRVIQASIIAFSNFSANHTLTYF